MKELKTPRILTVGSANIDFMARMGRIPSVGQTVIENSSYEYIPGGKGANTALAVSRLGGESIFCSKRGNDTHGPKLAEIYASSGINTRFVTVTQKARTGLALVMVEANGNNRIVAYPGANTYLRPEDVEEAMMCYPDAVLISLEIPYETVLATVNYANKAGVPVIIDAGPASKDYDLEALGEIEIFSPNETEIFTYTGIRATSTDNCLKACHALSNKVNAKHFVLKLGERGSFHYDGIYFDFIASHSVEAVDTTAAGDVFTAALGIEYIRSGNAKKACEYANIAGALTVTKEGAFTSVPTYEDMKNFVLKNGINYKLD